MTKMLIDIDNIEIPSLPEIKEQTTISITKILSDENLTIESILNYPTLLDELSSKNEELLKFFQKDKIKLLIDYIIKEPEEDNFEKGHKYPFLCCQIFKQNIDEILIQFFNNDDNFELLDYLLSFLPNKKEDIKKLNSILCGYFSSVIESLLIFNPKEFLLYIYSKRKDVLNIMSQFYNESILDILSKILYYENYFIKNDKLKLDDKSKNEFNKKRYDILIDIFKNIKMDMDNEELKAIFFFINKFFSNSNIDKLKDTFKKVIDNRYAMKNLIYNALYNTDLINYLDNDFNKIENKRKNFIIIIDIIIFLLKNIKFIKIDIPSCNSINDKKANIKHTKISQEIFNILERLIKVNFNKSNSKEKKILTSFNDYSFIPLGEYKIKIITFISHLIPYFSKIGKYFDEIIIKTNFFKFGFEYIFEYEWNNLYQEEFLNLMKMLLIYPSQHELLINHLFQDIKLFELIKNNFINNDNNKFNFNNNISSPISRGYKAFLINLCYKLNTSFGESPIGQNINGSFEFRHNDNNNKGIFGNFNLENNIYLDTNNPFHTNDNFENIVNDNLIDDEYMNKYLEKNLIEEWNIFYKNNILSLIKQYANKDWPKKNERNIYDFLFEEIDDNNINNNDFVEKIKSDEKNILDTIKENENNSINEKVILKKEEIE